MKPPFMPDSDFMAIKVVRIPHVKRFVGRSEVEVRDEAVGTDGCSAGLAGVSF